jgi:hypothetical protein
VFSLPYLKQVKAVVAPFEDRGNPFSHEEMDLCAMNLMATVDSKITNSLKNLAETGSGQ